jgi:hypothetical protein
MLFVLVSKSRALIFMFALLYLFQKNLKITFMTYEQAKKYMDKHANVINEKYKDVNNSFVITDMLIAPENSTLQEKIELLKNWHAEGISNENALINASKINEDLEVYVIGTEGEDYRIGLLSDHLANT